MHLSCGLGMEDAYIKETALCLYLQLIQRRLALQSPRTTSIESDVSFHMNSTHSPVHVLLNRSRIKRLETYLHGTKLQPSVSEFYSMYFDHSTINTITAILERHLEPDRSYAVAPISHGVKIALIVLGSLTAALLVLTMFLCCRRRQPDLQSYSLQEWPR
ncbi:hypothetical protein R6Q59_009886 [Mikania micrantha]